MPRIPAKSKNGQDILTAALKLHERDLWVVTCNGKRAVHKGWNKVRLTADDLRRDLNNGKAMNIAVALNQSDMIDVECDSEEAEGALQSLFGGEIPPTPTWKSKRGKHRLFRRPTGLPSKAVIKVAGIEFRIGNGKGALSVVPPSLHESGARYRWLHGLSLYDRDPAELPPEIVEQLRGSGAVTGTKTDGEIPEGKRNDTLFKLAGKLFNAGVSAESVEQTVQIENANRCKPPLSEDEVRGIVGSAKRSGPSNTAALLLQIAEADSELWHTPDDLVYVTIRRTGHSEHWPVRSRTFRQWLGKKYYDQKKAAPGSQAMQDAVNVLEGKGRFDGPEHSLFVRVAECDGRIYIDLADEKWRAIEIDALGWRIVDVSPVRFRRAKAMLPLPVPEPGGSITDLRRFVNVSDRDWPLLAAWLVATFRPSGPFPVLKLQGEQGTAKTTLARMSRSLIDPNTSPVRSAPRSDRDLMIAANNGWIVNFDNLSFVKPETSDALCRLATGGGFSTRTLYENDEETIFSAQRPVILNGIEDIGTRSDLLDRSLILQLPRIESSQRQPEKILWREFEVARPKIFGALLNAASSALKNLPAVEQSETEWPRMADFAMWVVAAEDALGLRPGEFLRAYSDNRKTANQTALESSPLVAALLNMLERRQGKFEGTATDLLNAVSIGQDTRAKGWPKAPKVLSGILSRLAPNLRAEGIEIEHTHSGSGNDRRKVWCIRSAEAVEADSEPSPNSDPCTPSGPFGDTQLGKLTQRRRVARAARVAKKVTDS